MEVLLVFGCIKSLALRYSGNQCSNAYAGSFHAGLHVYLHKLIKDMEIRLCLKPVIHETICGSGRQAAGLTAILTRKQAGLFSNDKSS
jgi:hypothetical protein